MQKKEIRIKLFVNFGSRNAIAILKGTNNMPKILLIKNI